MPRKEVHDAFEQMVLGYVTGMTDLMDKPSNTLHGHHRILFHDPFSIIGIAIALGGDINDNIIAGLIHILLDNSISGGKALIKNYAKLKKTKQVVNNRPLLDNLFNIIFGKQNGKKEKRRR